MGESGDKAVGPLLIKGLVEVGWHHDWARGTCSALQCGGSDWETKSISLAQQHNFLESTVGTLCHVL